MIPKYDINNQKAFNSYSRTINAVVGVGTEILLSDFSPKTNGPENTAPISIFRHFLDIIDSIGLLIRYGNADTPKILLRTALEASVYLKYIFKENSYERSMAYLVKQLYQEILDLERLNPNSEKGKKFRKVLHPEGSEDLLPFTAIEVEQLQQTKRDNLKNNPFKNNYEKLEALYLQKSKGHHQWYSLDSNANNFGQLCELVGERAVYEVFYNKWSLPIHSGNLINGRFFESENYRTEIVGLRHPADLALILEHTLKLCYDTFKGYVENRIPAQHRNFDPKLDAIRLKWHQMNERNSNM